MRLAVPTARVRRCASTRAREAFTNLKKSDANDESTLDELCRHWPAQRAAAPTGQQTAVDLVVVNAKVLTVDAQNTQAEAVAIRGNTFAAVGTTAAIRKMAGPQTRVIDAGGRTVVPGFIESHVHATGVARGEVSQVFIQLQSIQEIKDWVRARAGEAGPGGWVRLPRVDVTRIRDGRLPNKADLDEAAPSNPTVYTWQYANRNIQILNDAAIKAAKISKATVGAQGLHAPFHAGWRVHRQDGELPVAAEHSRAPGERS